MKKTVLLYWMLLGLVVAAFAQPAPLRCANVCSSSIPEEDTPEVMQARQMAYDLIESQVLLTATGNNPRTFKANIVDTGDANSWRYVPGLVAKATIKAWKYFKESTEYVQNTTFKADIDSYYTAIENFANQGTSQEVDGSDIDALNAGKIFFEIYNESKDNKYKMAADRFRSRLYIDNANATGSQKRIASATVAGVGNIGPTTIEGISGTISGEGGFWHKIQYENQMWLDGLYMGAAFYAEWQAEFEPTNTAAWDDITNQFKIVHAKTFNTEKGLNYHVWSADPEDQYNTNAGKSGGKDSFWARGKSEEYAGTSLEFWARANGWFFAALVDVLESMQKAEQRNTQNYNDLVTIVNQVADGLVRWQHSSGSWYQLLQYGTNGVANVSADNTANSCSGSDHQNKCSEANYLEASASSMFTYAYLKGIRLGILDAATYNPVAKKAYQGLLDNFITGTTTLSIGPSCSSAGLGEDSTNGCGRDGTVNYYLCGRDVDKTYNEGKAIGPFIMASLEYVELYGAK